MRRFWLFLLPIILLACTSSKKLIGTWESGMGGAHTLYHFREDGTFSMETTWELLVVKTSGKYRIESGSLVLEPSAASMDGPEDMKARATAEGRGNLMATGRVRMRWNTPASFDLLFSEGPPLMVTRRTTTP